MNHRIFSLVSAALLVLGLCAPGAWAHGGQFRGPGGAVPPGMRSPSDPTPPPPPAPPSGSPSTPTTPSVPGPSIPSSPDVTTPPNMPSAPTTGGRPTRRAGSIDFTDPSFWWGYNKPPYLELKKAIYHNISTDNPIGMLGMGAGNRGDNTHDVRALVQTTVLPTLLWAMDTKNKLHPDIESAAYIGLGKIAREPVHIDMLKRGLSLKGKSIRNVMVQEAAALAFGLLRRSDEAEQFTGGELDRTRAFLFDVFRNADYGVRVRGFAALSIGLLGDQPTGQDSETGATPGAATTARLFELLQESYAHEDLQIALLMAVGLQSPRAVDNRQREVLRAAVLKGRLFKSEASANVRAYATHALGRIGTDADVRVLQRALQGRSTTDARILQSAAIALGELSHLVDGPSRVTLAKSLVTAMGRKLKDPSARHFAYISLAYAIRDDVKARRTDVIEGSDAEELLLRVVAKGRKGERNYAGLALAIIAREIGDEPPAEAYGHLRSKIFEVLGKGIVNKAFDKRERANFAIAIGMGGDITRANTLLAFVKDKNESHELRGYSALALGLLGDGRKSVIRAVREALKDRRSEEMRIQCATALGLLHDRGAVPLLVEELEQARSLSAKAQVVLALARIGDDRAIEPLIGVLRGKKEQVYARAVSCAALGIVGDMERQPSLSRISVNANYRASTDLTREVLSIL